MMFTSLYRGSFYLMLTLATLTMSIDATDSKISMLFPFAVAIGGLVALLTVDRRPSLGLPRPAANGLAMGSIGLVLLEYLIEPNLLLIALAHFLVYLQLIKMFLPKTPEDDWFLLGLALMQVMVAAVISQSDRVGILMFAWAFSTLWVLSLFSLHRDALRYRVIAGPADSDAAAQNMAPTTWSRIDVPAVVAPSAPVEPYPGLLDVPFVLSGLRVTALTLALGGVIFLAMPRRGTAARPPQASDPLAGHLTGFDDEIQLGQLGEILENDSVVMSVEFYDEQQRKVTPPTGEPLWRGVTMSVYDRGRWHREQRGEHTFPIVHPGQKRTIRQSIKLEATDSPVLFGLRPIVRIKGGGRNAPEFNSNDGTFIRSEMRPGSLDYEVVSGLDPDAPQDGEALPTTGRIQQLLAVPDELRPRLKEITDPIVANIPPEDVTARVRALENYLRSSGLFTYSLRMTVVDPNVDPVEDFLVNRKEGHCEYYASALTLMVRSIGVPCRMVNGFKGGDWNDLAGVLNVRQKHAHSWVEAYLRDEERTQLPVWLTLDPTPALERQRSVDQVGGFGSNFRQFTDFIRYIWVFFIVGYNADRQHRLLYDPIRELIQNARSGFTMMGQAIRPAIANLLYFKNVGQFISVRGLIVSFTGLLFLSALAWLARYIFLRILRWYRGANPDSAALAAGVVFYRRLTQLLAEYGLERPPAETQQEFARRAIVFLNGQGSQTQSVADVPRLVVDAFYRVRFGHLDLTPERLTQLESRLDALEASLRSQDA